MAIPDQRAIYRFGGFVLDSGNEALRTTEGVAMPLRPKSFALLRLMVENAGRLVARATIMEALWPNLFVSDDNITQCVHDVRRALGREARDLLRTLPRRGYVFEADAVRQEPVFSMQVAGVDDSRSGNLRNIARRVLLDSRPPVAPQAALSLLDKPSVAILPLTIISNDREQEFLADGIAEDLITALSRFPSLLVIARASCFSYKGRAVDVKQVGRELGVRYVLGGSLRQSGNHIRVAAHLIDAESGMHVWAERYDRDLADIFAVQDEIADAVTISVAPVIGRAEMQRAIRKPPESLDAWAAYQRGLWHLGKSTAEDNTLAQRSFERAITLEPIFGGGYRGLAAARRESAALFQRGGLCEAQASAEALSRRAAELDNNDAEARRHVGSALLWGGDYEGALAEIKRALEMAPNVAEAHGLLGATLIFSGRAKEGLAAVQTCIRLDPRNSYLVHWLLWIAIAHYFSEEYETAVDVLKRGIRGNPHFPLSHRWLAAALGQLERTAQAREALQKAIAIAPGTFDMYVCGRVPWMRPEDHAHMVEGLRKAGWPH